MAPKTATASASVQSLAASNAAPLFSG
jgi:hypothetical protein